MDIVEIFQLPGLLLQLIQGFFFVMMYPVYHIINSVLLIINLIYEPLALFINNLINVYFNLIGAFNILFASSLPTPWVTLMLGIIGLTVAFRIYRLIENIEILGFSI